MVTDTTEKDLEAATADSAVIVDLVAARVEVRNNQVQTWETT